MDIERGEMAEKQLDILIERRARKREVDRDEREELWMESVRRYNAPRRRLEPAPECQEQVSIRVKERST